MSIAAVVILSATLVGVVLVAVLLLIVRGIRKDMRALRVHIESERVRRDDLARKVAGHPTPQRERHLRSLKPPIVAVLAGFGAAWAMSRQHAVLTLAGVAAAATAGTLLLTPIHRSEPPLHPPAHIAAPTTQPRPSSLPTAASTVRAKPQPVRTSGPAPNPPPMGSKTGPDPTTAPPATTTADVPAVVPTVRLTTTLPLPTTPSVTPPATATVTSTVTPHKRCTLRVGRLIVLCVRP